MEQGRRMARLDRARTRLQGHCSGEQKMMLLCHCEKWPQHHGRQSRYSPVFTILDRGLAKAGPVQKWGVPASVCAGGEDAVL